MQSVDHHVHEDDSTADENVVNHLVNAFELKNDRVCQFESAIFLVHCHYGQPFSSLCFLQVIGRFSII